MSEDKQKIDDEVYVKVSLKQMKELTLYAFGIMDIIKEIRDNHKEITINEIASLMKETKDELKRCEEPKPEEFNKEQSNELTPTESKQELEEIKKEEPKLTTQLKSYYKNHERRREEAKLRARKKKEEAYLKEHGNLEGFKIKEYIKYKK